MQTLIWDLEMKLRRHPFKMRLERGAAYRRDGVGGTSTGQWCTADLHFPIEIQQVEYCIRVMGVEKVGVKQYHWPVHFPSLLNDATRSRVDSDMWKKLRCSSMQTSGSLVMLSLIKKSTRDGWEEYLYLPRQECLVSRRLSFASYRRWSS